MTREHFNIPIDRIEWVCITLDCEFGKAIRLLQLIGFIEHVNTVSNQYGFKQGVYSRKTRLSRTTVRDDLILLSKLGWINVLTGADGTDIELLEIPFSSDPRTEEGRPEGGRPEGVPRTEGVRGDVQRESDPPDSGSPTSKKDSKNSPYGEGKNPSASTSKKELQKDLVLKWNEWKPKSWCELKAISPSRERSIKALGGYREVINLIPAFMAGAKSSKFWISKDISFENVIGTGVTPKGHFHELAERGSSANTHSAGTLAKPPEHPDFFPPLDAFTDLRPKVNDFIDDADRDRREAEAREFYAKQLEAGK